MTDFQAEFDRIQAQLTDSDPLAQYAPELKKLIEIARKEDEYWFHRLTSRLLACDPAYSLTPTEFDHHRNYVISRLSASGTSDIPTEKAADDLWLRDYLFSLFHRQMHTLGASGKIKEAAALCDQALDLPEPMQMEESRKLFFLWNKGNFLAESNYAPEADAVFCELIRQYRESSSPAVLDYVLQAIYSKISLCHDAQRPEQELSGMMERALEDCRIFAARTGRDFSGNIAGFLLLSGGIARDPLVAIRRYDEVIHTIGSHPDPEMTTFVATALLNKAIRYSQIPDFPSALAGLDDFLATYHKSSHSTIPYLVREARNIREEILQRQQEEAKPAE